MDHMKGNLANMARLLTEMRSLLEELKNLIGPQVPASVDDLINSVDATSVSTHELHVKLNDVNKKINNLQIAGLTANHPALQTLTRLKEKLSELLRLSMANSVPQLNAVGQQQQVNVPSKFAVLKSILLLPSYPNVNVLTPEQKALIANELASQNDSPTLYAELNRFFCNGEMLNHAKSHFENAFFRQADLVVSNKYRDLSNINNNINEKEAIQNQISTALNPQVYNPVKFELDRFLAIERDSHERGFDNAFKSEINNFINFGLLENPSHLRTNLQNYLPILIAEIQRLKIDRQQQENAFLA